jgi:tRNA-guanine family transglycosylase
MLTVCTAENLRLDGDVEDGVQDSGGFQLVSLSKFTTITEEGALFASPFTGEPTLLTVGLLCERSW